RAAPSPGTPQGSRRARRARRRRDRCAARSGPRASRRLPPWRPRARSRTGRRGGCSAVVRRRPDAGPPAWVPACSPDRSKPRRSGRVNVASVPIDTRAGKTPGAGGRPRSEPPRVDRCAGGWYGRTRMSERTSQDGALAGIRVIDLSHQAAGPWCTSLLGDLGADVVKIEKPGRGDSIRYADRTGRLPPEVGGLNFQGLNRNKRGLTVDIGQEAGAALARP